MAVSLTTSGSRLPPVFPDSMAPTSAPHAPMPREHLGAASPCRPWGQHHPQSRSGLHPSADQPRPDDRVGPVRTNLPGSAARAPGPGDAVFIPEGWYHQVDRRRRQPAAVNLWWPSEFSRLSPRVPHGAVLLPPKGPLQSLVGKEKAAAVRSAGQTGFSCAGARGRGMEAEAP